MSASYEIWLLAPDRDYALDAIDNWERLEYTKRVGDVGAFELLLPGSWDWRLARLDSRVVVWRKPQNGARYLEAAFFLRNLERLYVGGAYKTIIRGPAYNELLARRVIAYRAETREAGAPTHSNKTDYADDMMKAFVYENLGAGCLDSDRDISAYGFTIQADLSAGPVIEKSASFNSLLTTVQAISRAAREAGTSVYFGVVPLGNGWDMEFRTRTLCWGVDHSYPAGAGGVVIFAVEKGNMVDPRMFYDLRDEANVVYGLGAGEGVARVVEEVEDTRRSGFSLLNRREAVYDNPNIDLASTLQDEAENRLDELTYRHGMTFTVQDTPSSAYGLHWGFGDLVTASFLGELYAFHVDAVHVTVEGGSEKVDVTLREWDDT